MWRKVWLVRSRPRRWHSCARHAMWRETPIRSGQMLETANISTKLRLAALGSIAVAVAVFGLKFLAYWRTGSVALYSDALESIVNLVTAFAALYAVHVANQPADRQH